MNGFQQPELAEVARKRRMAELLMQSQMPQGQMVSGHYAPPAFTQQLATALNLYKGGKLSKEADEQEKAMAQALQQKREGWLGQMPMATDNTSMAGPAIPQTPTAQDYMAWALKGQQIDPQAAQMGMQSANMQLNRESQAESRAQQEQLRRDQMAQQAAQAEQQRALQREMAQMRTQQGQSPYFQFIGSPEGIVVGNSRTGKLSIADVAGKPMMKASDDPRLQGEIAQAKTTATETAKRQVEGKFEAPEAIAKGEEALRLVDDLLKSPGFKQAVGASRMVGIQNIPGTSAKDFDIRLDQLKGQQFLQAFESLKGGGQITEVEGKKATDAISRMNASASEEEFQKAAREFQDVIRRGIDRAKQKGGTPAPAAPKRIRFDAQGNMIQ